MFPRWLTWLLLGVMAYLVYSNTMTHRPESITPVVTPAPVAAAPEAATPVTTTPAPAYPKLAEVSDIEHWKKAINPQYAAIAQCDFKSAATDSLPLQMTTDKAGNGDAASCTDRILVRLVVWNARGTIAYKGEVPLALGSRQVAAGLDSALVGIRAGETRTLTLPPEALAHAKKTDAPHALLNALHPGNVTVVTATRLN